VLTTGTVRAMSHPYAPASDDLRATVLAGAVAVLPVLVGIVPFGLVTGASASAAGLTLWDAVASSVLVFAGASQLAMIDLLGRDAPVLVAVLTAAVINVRMVMYSASLSPFLAGTPIAGRAAAAYVLTDQAYALSVTHYPRDHGPATPRGRLAYYLGVGLPLWTTWQVVTVVGHVVGAQVPDGVPLAATVPLVFLALLVPAVVDRPTLWAALVGGTTAIVAAPLPANLGLLVGAAAGITASALSDVRADAPRTREGAA
jgi:predicted branched-subunit amino acid permease